MTTPKYRLSGKHWVSPGQTCVDSGLSGQHPPCYIIEEAAAMLTVTRSQGANKCVQTKQIRAFHHTNSNMPFL